MDLAGNSLKEVDLVVNSLKEVDLAVNSLKEVDPAATNSEIMQHQDNGCNLLLDSGILRNR